MNIMTLCWILLMSLLNPFHAERLIKYSFSLGIFHVNIFPLLKATNSYVLCHPQMAEEVPFTECTKTKVIQTRRFIFEQEML